VGQQKCERCHGKSKNHSKKIQISTSSCVEETREDYQPGGVACLLLNKWTGRNIERITDTSGLGRWAGYKMRGKNNKEIVVLSAYRPTRSSDPGDSTCYSQQWNTLRITKGTPSPEPRKEFITDLTNEIKEWEKQKCEIIIGLDANESMESTNSMIKTLVDNTTLHSLVKSENEKEPETHTRGTKCIDFMLGTQKVKDLIVAAGYLPFYAGAFDSDHRALMIDLDAEILFGRVDQHSSQTVRNLKSTNKVKVEIFMTKLSKERTY
jgi:hypothetical protein